MEGTGVQRMTEQVKLWANKENRFTTSELKEIEKLVEARKLDGKNYCPYRKFDKSGKQFCSINTRRCIREESYTECDFFLEWFTEALGSKFEDLLPVGTPF